MALVSYHFRPMALMMKGIVNTLRQKQKNDLTGYACPDILSLQLPAGVAL